MNIFLFTDEKETLKPIPAKDPRCIHIKTILRKKVGDTIKAGIINKSVGVAYIKNIGELGYYFKYIKEASCPYPAPLSLILGFPRPIQTKRVLKDLSSLCIEDIFLCPTELGEKSYLESKVFNEANFKSALYEGASQGSTSRIPNTETFQNLEKCLQDLKFKNYKSKIVFQPESASIKSFNIQGPVAFAIGSERGWTTNELELFSDYGFTSLALGKRILRTETASIAATILLLNNLDLL